MCLLASSVLTKPAFCQDPHQRDSLQTKALLLGKWNLAQVECPDTLRYRSLFFPPHEYEKVKKLEKKIFISFMDEVPTQSDVKLLGCTFYDGCNTKTATVVINDDTLQTVSRGWRPTMLHCQRQMSITRFMNSIQFQVGSDSLLLEIPGPLNCRLIFDRE